MTAISTIRYDRDEPHIMKMAWDEWLKTKGDLNDTTINTIYDRWLAGQSDLCIDQKTWSRIVTTFL